MPEIELRIDSIAAGGDGVGRHEGMVVFVPRTAPGDLVRVTATPHGRLMRGRLTRLIEPSGTRTEPPCPHYVRDRCGGCQLQHMTYDAQLSAKGAIIRDALNRIGGAAVGEPPQVEPSDQPWRYRRKLTLALRRDGAGWVAGLHRYDAPDAIFPLADCPITDPGVLDVWRAVMARQEHFPHARTLRGAVRQLSRGYAFVLEGARSWPRRDDFFDTLPQLAELWWIPEDGSRRRLRARAVDEAGASFVQVNPGVAARLREWVSALAAPLNAGTVVDAYAGTGEIAAVLAAQGARVTAIEIDRDAARVAAGRLPAGSSVITGAVEDTLAGALPAELVVLNPPRAGVHERVTHALESQMPRPRAVLYVSCNPATLARDVRRLPAFRVRSLRGFDMFPQTAHVETVCELVPAA